MKTTLVIGSGTSYVSGILGLGEITKLVESGENIGRVSDSNYYRNQGSTQQTQKNVIFIKIIKEIIVEFFNTEKVLREPNYEDYYYLLKQIFDTLYKEYENPAIYPLITKLKSHEHFTNLEFEREVKEAVKYIECVVGFMIFWKGSTLEQFNILPSLIEKFNLVDVVSLNHDLLLDTYLESSGIKFYDGFTTKDFKFPNWSGFQEKEEGVLQVYKLHGSVNWLDIHVHNEFEYNEIFKMPNDIYWETVRDVDPKMISPVNGAPHLLIGTFNKMLGYLGGVFESLYDQYKIALQNSSHIIVSGYGFGDKGINSKLSLWLNLDAAVKMIIIHPSKVDLIKNARGAFYWNLMNESHTHPKVVLIEKKFEDVTFDEIDNIIAN